MFSCHVNASNMGAVLQVTGDFDLQSHRRFYAACDEALGTPGINEIALDLSAVHQIDSSALGMILMLSERAKRDSVRLWISKCSQRVRHALDVANFSRIIEVASTGPQDETQSVPDEKPDQ